MTRNFTKEIIAHTALVLGSIVLLAALLVGR
jgi:hypothetical protein